MAKKKAKALAPPKKKERKYTMPVEHLDMVADRILTTAPTKAIILNTLEDVWKNGRDYGYFGRIREAKVFNDKREKIIKDTFDGIKDMVDDVIHGGIVPQESNNENNS